MQILFYNAKTAIKFRKIWNFGQKYEAHESQSHIADQPSALESWAVHNL